MTLAQYKTATRRLLHDPNAVLWTDTVVLNAFVNDAIKERDRVTACVRSLISLTLTAGDDNYAFSELSNTRVVDVVNINIIDTGRRWVLSRLPFTRLNTTIRAYSGTSYRDRPRAWAKYGSNVVYFAPNPASAYTTEWDCVVYTADLATDAADDNVPYPFTEPVPYYAAYLCKINERQYDEAEEFLTMFREGCNALNGNQVGMMPNPYGITS